MMSKLTKLASGGDTDIRRHGDTEQRLICIDICKLPYQMKLYLIIWYLPHDAKAASLNEAAM